jgi:hypothetical protein
VEALRLFFPDLDAAQRSLRQRRMAPAGLPVGVMDPPESGDDPDPGLDLTAA